MTSGGGCGCGCGEPAPAPKKKPQTQRALTTLNALKALGKPVDAALDILKKITGES
ncbi:Uncharacterised protein [Candidatus Tiddalikarchaeum anstoanum]|nr:Uncharacterised protein [Candidatus Tiddalikarchaeum anstoanum]